MGNTFGGTALASYGAFWLSFAGIRMPKILLCCRLRDDVTNSIMPLGSISLPARIFTFMLWLCIKSTFGLHIVVLLIVLTFILLGAE